MSEYDKSQSYNVYDYNAATRPQEGHYPAFGAAPPQYAAQYQAQVPSGLPQSTALSLGPPAQQYPPHDPSYYAQPHGQYPAYLETPSRQAPEIISYTPTQGQHGTKVTVRFRSVYDLDALAATVVIMFGTKRCQSVLQRTPPQSQMYEYALSADAPLFVTTGSPSPVPLHLLIEESNFAWDSPSLEFGSFTYFDALPSRQSFSPEPPSRKRKLSPRASPRQSPIKRSSTSRLDPRTEQRTYLQGSASTTTPASPFRRPSIPDAYSQTRRFSGAEHQYGYTTSVPHAHLQYYSQQGQATPSTRTSHSPSWAYPSLVYANRSPSSAPIAAGSRSSHLMPSPAGQSNPPLMRTSTIQQSSATPASSSTTFNPYAVYPTNAKAILKLEGDLNSMSANWTAAEWNDNRRLVQFKRSQSGSVITATFESVTPEARAPNSICVSCIWWEEKKECYVTSVDTIQLLESLVAVRFTVEEKNRIRRNLEGFRPATVSKAKAESEDFFKLIMGFPTPKPRNIEKDVKSASYASTAGALHAPASAGYSTARASDAGIDQRPAVSPRSTSSSATSYGHAYAPTITTHAFTPHVSAPAAALGIGPSAGHPPDLRLAVPVSSSQTTSWHQPATSYGPAELNRSSWDYNSYLGASPATGPTGLPGSAQAYQYPQHRFPSLLSQTGLSTEARFVPLHDYEEPGQPTTTTS